jgi:hypothetical protein
LFDIFIDDPGLHDTCSEHGICMGQTDVASCYTDDERTILHPWLAKLMDYIHTWLNKWRNGNFTKSDVDFTLRRVKQRRRRTAGTPGH